MAAKRRSPFAPPKLTAPPTERQDEFLALVGTLTAQLGRGPSTGEIAAAMGITHSGARRQLHALEKRGLIGDVPRTVRSGTWTLR